MSELFNMVTPVTCVRCEVRWALTTAPLIPTDCITGELRRQAIKGDGYFCIRPYGKGGELLPLFNWRCRFILKSAMVLGLSKLKRGLMRTHNAIIGTLENSFSEVTREDLLDSLEDSLIASDVGAARAIEIVDRLRGISVGNDLEKLKEALGEEIYAILERVEAPLEVRLPAMAAEGGGEEAKVPFVIMALGVNGVGKTTTIGKLASRFTGEGKKVILGAGDTFRAAAVEQLELWGERTGCQVIKQAEGGDPGAVAFDAVNAAISRKADVLILDTAGRLHTQVNLMEELKKVDRVVARALPGAPHERLLLMDATTGQNGLVQARLFNEAVDVTGLGITKLDGSAKGGVVVAIADELKIPIRLIGVGEGVEDLRDFEARGFVDALL